MADANDFQENDEFAAFQQRRRAELWGLLGDLPPSTSPTARLLQTENRPGYTLERLQLELNGAESVPALLLIPEKRRQPAPGLLYIHSHGGHYELGKEELYEGIDVLPAYAPVCAELGLVTLAIDSWCFSGRQHKADGARGEQDAFKHMLWHGRVLWGMMMFDEFQAVTYLAGRPEVDASRLGAFGLSMGATKAWWLAALDPRIRACLNLCCLTDFEAIERIDNLAGHGIYYYVPRLLQHFQTHDICALIVPRPHISLNGRRDLLTPPDGVERVRNYLAPLYRKFGREEDCRIELFDCGHEETPEMRRRIVDGLVRYLGPASMFLG
jgi:hypothetical protein